ncbi:MAG: very short patch repair endonuclease [Chlorobi bacterium]|nr:very short patch repair endonuclease [Chlorobiota bacterium]
MKKYPENNIKVPRFREENGFYTTKERSKLMSKIRGKDTKPEVMFRKALWARGYRYRKNVKKLPGKPDVVLRKFKLAIFIDGEFWHGHNWEEKKKSIKSNRAFWIPKIERNMQRDEQVEEELKDMDFTVFRFWEQQIKKDLGTCLEEVVEYIERFKLVSGKV